MAKSRRSVLPAAEARVAHTKQKPKPRFVSKAHVQERKGDDVLAFEDVRRVMEREQSERKRRKP
jgi:hypothetical protein